MTVDELRDVILARHYRWTTEYELQAALEQVLTEAGAHVEREKQLPGVGRLDFYIDRVAVEVKIKGSTAEVMRQLGRYARHDDVDGIVLATTCARHMAIPSSMFDVPVAVAPLLGGLL